MTIYIVFFTSLSYASTNIFIPINCSAYKFSDKIFHTSLSSSLELIYIYIYIKLNHRIIKEII